MFREKRECVCVYGWGVLGYIISPFYWKFTSRFSRCKQFWQLKPNYKKKVLSKGINAMVQINNKVQVNMAT